MSSERKVDSNGKGKVDSPCGLLPKTSWIHTPFYYISISLNGKARVYDRLGKSFEGRAQGAGSYREMTIQEALDFVKKSSIYVWEHNDRKYLCEEYGLRKSTVLAYFNNCGYGLEDGPHPWNEE
jgi:hypothetical protein